MVRLGPADLDPGAPPAAGRHDGDPELLESRVLQLAAGQGLRRVLGTAVPVSPHTQRLHAGVLRDRRRVHPGRGVFHLALAMAADPLATLADRAVPRRVARGSRLLPHQPHHRPRRGRHRQPGPAHRRGHSRLHRQHADARHQPAGEHRHAGQLPRHPVVAVRQLHAVRHRHPRLHGLGRAALCGRRHLAHPSGRPSAGRTAVPPAARGGRLPLQPGARAREHGRHRAVLRRDRGKGDCSATASPA